MRIKRNTLNLLNVKNKNIKLNKIKMRLIYAYPYLINNDRVVKRLYKLKKDFSKRKNL